MKVFKPKRYQYKQRLLTEPAVESTGPSEEPSRQISKKRIEYGQVYRPLHQRQTSSIATIQNTYKPSQSEIISVKEQPGKGRTEEPQLKKRKNYRYLTIETDKDKSVAPLSKSLSKSKNQSIDSLRIHKIRSITSLNQRNQEARKMTKGNHETLKPCRPHRYETTDSDKDLVSLERKKLVRSIMEERSSNKQRVQLKRPSPRKNRRNEIKEAFSKLQESIKRIEKDTYEHERQMNTVDYQLSSLKLKNIQGGLRVVGFFMRRRNKKAMRVSWDILSQLQ